jgi:hypothetical protein
VQLLSHTLTHMLHSYTSFRKKCTIKSSENEKAGLTFDPRDRKLRVYICAQQADDDYHIPKFVLHLHVSYAVAVRSLQLPHTDIFLLTKIYCYNKEVYEIVKITHYNRDNKFK